MEIPETGNTGCGIKLGRIDMKQYNVTGMSCAACSARVEKAVSKVPGVTACSVSLLTNSMGVEGTAPDREIIAAVEGAGYGASVKGAAPETNVGDGGGPSGPGNSGAEAAPDLVRGISDGSDVLLHGSHDVGLVPAALL